MVVRQHYESPRKFVVLTAQGAHIFFKLRPVDMLLQLLLDCHGPDSEAIKMFFVILKEEQACTTSLILGCLENIQNVEVAEWTARAFFLYGEKPNTAQPFGLTNLNQFRVSSVSNSFILNIVSTPLPPHLQQQQQVNYSTVHWTNQILMTILMLIRLLFCKTQRAVFGKNIGAHLESAPSRNRQMCLNLERQKKKKLKILKILLLKSN